MPQLDRVDQLPLPNLNLYAGFSGLALFYAVVYALTSAQDNFASMLWSDVWCTAAVLNMGCCSFFLLARFIHSLVFGKLQHIEHQHMRDKFWNFVFYKFIFVFGVMNVQEMPELLCWCVWFAMLGTLLLTEQLCKDRFQFLSFSPNTPTSSHAKIIVLLSIILLSCAGLFMVCAVVGWQYGFNHFTFLYSEVFILFARALLSIIKHIIHLWDMHHEGVWENRSTYTYYTELILEMAVLCVDFMHHVHMLLWANMFLSVASLILLMKLRFLYQEIQRRLKRHRNYILVSETLENRFVQVPSHELMMSDETCAICWEKMRSARQLPCGHLFHAVCLRAWLEQDTVCPTCRRSLSDDLHQREQTDPERREGEEERGRGRGLQRNMRNARNWLLRFNGASIASWLPTFSLELHQEEDPRWISDAAELHRVAQQIHSMFPHVPLQAITLDLADTHSVSITVDRILTDSIYIPGEGGVITNQVEGNATPTSPSNNTNTEENSTEIAHSSQQNLPPPQPTSTSSAPLNVPSQAEKPQNSDSGDHQGCDSDELKESNNVSKDSHDPQPRKSHDLQESHDSSEANTQHNQSNLRLRKTASKVAPENIQLVETIESSSKKHCSSDTNFPVSKEDYSHLFTSLQERKAELLRKAKRNYLLKEEQSNSHRKET